LYLVTNEASNGALLIDDRENRIIFLLLSFAISNISSIAKYEIKKDFQIVGLIQKTA